MSESAARNMRDQRPSIDLEEFERRLRAPDPQRRSEDPLAELARLVGSANDPFKDLFAPKSQAHQSTQGYGAPGAQYADQGQYPTGVNSETAPQVLHDLAGQMRQAASDLPPGASEYASHDQGQGVVSHGVQPHWEQVADPHAHNYPQESHLQAEYAQSHPGMGAQAQWQDQSPPAAYAQRPEFQAPPEAANARRFSLSRRGVVYMGSALGVIVLGLGATLATGSKFGTGAIPIVAAPKDPVKVKPVEDASTARPVRTVGILDKTVGTKPQQSNAVSREEQPVDLSQVQDQPRGARPADNDINRLLNLNSRDAIKPVATVAPQSTSAPQSGGYFPEPRKVRTVSVKPDGSVVAEPQPVQTQARPPAPATSVAAPPVRPPVAAASAAPPASGVRSPTAATAPVSATEKTTVRANRPPTLTETARVAGDPEQAARAPQQVAARPVTPAATTPRPAASRAAENAAPTTTARIPAPAAAASGGSFAIQLAAPASEAEAQSAMTLLRQRFATELGGRSPSIRQAKVGDKTVYRVRVGGLSREDATELCSKLQGKGGACFVARN